MRASGNGSIWWFEDFAAGDIAAVGGKNASLGEMIATLQGAGIRVPRGFAISTDAYWRLVRHNDIDAEVRKHLEDYRAGIDSAGKAIRALFREATFPDDLAHDVAISR